METIQTKCNHKPMKKVVFGLLLLTAGSLLLAFNFGVLPYEWKSVFFSWPMLLVAVGLINLFSKDGYIFGIILMITGGYFLTFKFFPEHYDVLKLYWPVLLIAAGLLIIMKRSIFNVKKRIQLKASDSSFIEEVNVFGGNKHIINAQEFKGGKLINVFGGSHIDLTQTKLGEGKNVLEMVCVFGGVELIVPSDWVIHVEVASVLGGFADKRANINTTPQLGKELYIKGVVVFGGGEIKNYA